MVKRAENTIKQFKGMRNDEDSKQIPIEYLYKIINYDFPKTGVKGLDKILMPERIQQIGSDSIDGGYEYRYLDENNVLQTKNIVVSGGNIVMTDLYNTPTTLKTGLTAGKVTFATYKDKCFIANGLNYVNVYDGNLGLVTEMGAPFAVLTDTAGGVNEGSHYYCMTYVTAGGEQILGSVSNAVVVPAHSGGREIELHLNTGFTGTLTRNLYRTAANGTDLKFLVSIPNNTTLTYTDTIEDAYLGAIINVPNNELPKPYILAVNKQMLYGAVVDKYPTQMYATDVGCEVWNWLNFIDVSNYADDDNTPVEGMGIDFGRIMVMSGRNTFIDNYDTTELVHNIIMTRANVGCKNRYSVKRLPSFGDFQGGLAFLSTNGDIRIMSGMSETSLPVSTVIDNIRTDNIGQAIRGDLDKEIKILSNVHCEFYDYKYHLILNNTTYKFDIRMQGWTTQRVQTDSYLSNPQCLFILGNILYNGQPDGWIEQEYSKIQYRSEDVEAYLGSAHIAVDERFKILEVMKLWFIPSIQNTINLTVFTDDNNTASDSVTFSILANGDFTVKGGVFNSQYFSPIFFNVDTVGMDYRTININKECRWFRWVLRNKIGNASFQGYTLIGQEIENAERA